jgi:peptidoglycan hydrolase CwlO-like protein
MVKTPLPPTAIEKVITWIGSVPSMIFHSCVFLGFLILVLIGPFPRDLVLLVWNTIVSLEAIYLAIFIQFSVNRNTVSLREVEEDIDEIQEDVEDLGEDLEEIQEDIEEMSEDVEEMSEDVEEMQKDLEELNEEEEAEEQMHRDHAKNIDKLTEDIRRVLKDLETLKEKNG